LWFENTSFLHEQMLDTPVGRFSIRQMGIFLIFGLLAWFSSLAFADLVPKVVVAGSIFFSGATVFTRKIKTISPEAHLLHLTQQFITQIKQKRSAAKTKPSTEPESKSLVLSATLGEPVRIGGVLKDLTGKILQDKNFHVIVNDTVHSNGTTDQEGNFCTYFIPEHVGVFQIDIQPQDHQEPTLQIILNAQQSKPKKQQTEEEREATKNAEKNTNTTKS
jgi:hypothetical protein